MTLRQVFTLLFLYALSFGIASAQTQEEQYPFSQSLLIGIGAGPSYARFNFVPSVRQHAYRGYSTGVSLRYNVERGASFQLEVNYTKTGFSERYDEATLAYRRNIEYIDVPLMTHLYLRQGRANFFVNAGPYAGWMIAESSTQRGSSESFDTNQNLRHSLPVVNKLEWGLCGGLGVSIGLGSRHRIELEGRIHYGFGDIWSSKRTDPYGQSSEMRYGALLHYYYRL